MQMNTRILSISHTPPTAVSKSATVKEAVSAMVQSHVGAVAVLDQDKLAGIFTERDLMTKVVEQGLDPTTTPVAQVMTTQVEPINGESSEGSALRVMTQRHFRHMPVCDESGKVLGMLSLRNLLQHRVEDLASELDSLEAYLTADGPGG